MGLGSGIGELPIDKAELALCGLADVVDMFGPRQFGCDSNTQILDGRDYRDGVAVDTEVERDGMG